MIFNRKFIYFRLNQDFFYKWERGAVSAGTEIFKFWYPPRGKYCTNLVQDINFIKMFHENFNKINIGIWRTMQDSNPQPMQ